MMSSDVMATSGSRKSHDQENNGNHENMIIMDTSMIRTYVHAPHKLPTVYILGMGGVDILAYDYCKAKISRLSRLLLQLYLC